MSKEWDGHLNNTFRSAIEEKIKKLEQTLERYRWQEGDHAMHMETVLKGEISTLNWVLNLNKELQG